MSKEKKRSYIDRNPHAAHVYSKLSDEQKKILDEISFRDAYNLEKTQKAVMERLLNTFIIPAMPRASKQRLVDETKMLYQACRNTLLSAELTVNVGSSLFAIDDFYNSSEVKTVWTFKTNKSANYNKKRNNVEQKAFGFKIDWNVPLARAAMMRPVYAGLNYVSHPYGCATAYGSVVLALKPKVNLRASYIHGDTYDNEFQFDTREGQDLLDQQNKICTRVSIEKLMVNMGKTQLKALVQASQNRYIFSDYAPPYVEAHILGGVRWDRDLREIRVASTGDMTLEKEASIAKKQPDTLAYLISEFAKKHNVKASYWNCGRLIKYF